MTEALVTGRDLIMSFDRQSDGHRSVSPELTLVATVIFILNLHYAFDHPRQVGYLDALLCKWAIPVSGELLSRWETLQRQFTLSFRHLPAQGELPWDQLDAYLSYCDQLGMRSASAAGGSEQRHQQHQPCPDPPRSLGSSADYPTGPTDPDSLIGLFRDLRGTKKLWTLVETDSMDSLPAAYQRLLEVASNLIDWSDPLDLLRRINKLFYQK